MMFKEVNFINGRTKMIQNKNLSYGENGSRLNQFQQQI